MVGKYGPKCLTSFLQVLSVNIEGTLKEYKIFEKVFSLYLNHDLLKWGLDATRRKGLQSRSSCYLIPSAKSQDLTLYLICQFQALPIQQQIKI